MLRLSRRTMWHPAVLYHAVLFSTILVDGQFTCDSDGPDNCTFVRGLSSCSWTFDSNEWIYDRSCAVFGTGISSGANMTSRPACSTGGDPHCLQIRYLFEGNNSNMRVLLISDRDEDDGDDSVVLEVWNGPDLGTGVWHAARIPIQSKGNFNITVEARKSTLDLGRIFINSIHYIKAPCAGIQTSTVPSPVTNTQEERTTTIDPHVSTGEQAPNIVGVGVGVVIAVVVVVVAIVILFLYPQKRLHLWRTCFRNSKRTDTAVTSQSRNTVETLGNNDTVTPTGVIATSGHDDQSLYLTPISHEYTYITASPDAGISTGQNTTPTGTNSVDQQLYTTPGARSPDNDYSVLGNIAGSDAALPHNPYVNQTMRPDNQNTRDTFRRNSDDPYEVV